MHPNFAKHQFSKNPAKDAPIPEKPEPLPLDQQLPALRKLIRESPTEMRQTGKNGGQALFYRIEQRKLVEIFGTEP